MYPRKLNLLFFCVGAVWLCASIRLPAQQQPSAPGRPLAISPQALAPLAAQITENAERIGCRAGKCKILITSFVFPGSGTSQFGIQLADALAAQLSQGEKGFEVVDRATARKFAQQERVSAQNQASELMARWIARELKADAVLTGEITVTGSNSVELSARLFQVEGQKNKALGLKGTLHIDLSHADLSRTDDLPELPAFDNKSNGEPVYPYLPGSTLPSCSYMPSPPYTEQARNDHVSGVILVKAIVDTHGHLAGAQIVKGLPDGLNENTLKTLSTWRCEAPKVDGQPVPTVVTFEVNFRLYN
jgi:TonB family protein